MNQRNPSDATYAQATATQGDTQIGDTRTGDDGGAAVTDIATQNTARVERGTADSTRRATVDDENQGFLPEDRMTDLRSRWDDVQAGFVDDPRAAVQQAQALVKSLVDELVNTFSRERDNLEGQWNSGGNVDTEALRVALQRYRSFFNRLLST